MMNTDIHTDAVFDVELWKQLPLEMIEKIIAEYVVKYNINRYLSYNKGVYYNIIDVLADASDNYFIHPKNISVLGQYMLDYCSKIYPIHKIFIKARSAIT